MTTAATAPPAARPTEPKKYEPVSNAGTKTATVKIWTLRRGGGSSRSPSHSNQAPAAGRSQELSSTCPRGSR
jgi:hypothetical protein